jgi:hypothetical protein
MRCCGIDEAKGATMSLTDSVKMRGVTDRAKAMILHPRSEWDVIAGEATTVRGLFTGYVMYLAAIPPICMVIGTLVFGLFGRHGSLLGALVGGIIEYAFTIAGVYLMGLIIEFAAPYFGGTKDRIQAMKVSAYFPTAVWLIGVVGLIPPLGPLRLLGLYSLFILYLGLPKLMRTAEDKGLIYTLVVIVSSLIVWMVIGLVVAAVSMPMMVASGGL